MTGGGTILTAALSEDGIEDAAVPQTVARRVGDSWELRGVKIAVPAAHLAKRVLVPAG